MPAPKIEKKRKRNRKARTEVSPSPSSSSSSSATPPPKLSKKKTKSPKTQSKQAPAEPQATDPTPRSSPSEEHPTRNDPAPRRPGFASLSAPDPQAAFAAFHLQQSTREYADDLEKLRAAKDFHGEAGVGLLVRALRRGAAAFPAADRLRIGAAAAAAIEAKGGETEE